MVNIQKKYMTKNDCYKDNRWIKPIGAIVHLTATPGVMAADWFSRWNKSGVKKAVHFFVDDKEIWQYLPDAMRGWHGGGAVNNTHIGIEGCEPAGHRYQGSTLIGYDVKKNKEYFDAMYKNYIDLAVHLCHKFGWTEKDFLGHNEAGRQGIASRSADPDNLFRPHDKSMDIFRADVKRRLEDKSFNNTHTVTKGDTLWAISQNYKVTVDELKRINNLKADLIKAGQVLKIPGKASNTSNPKPSKSKAIAVDGYWGRETTRALQKALGTIQDGIISGQYRNNTTKMITSGMNYGPPYTGSNVVRALQRKIGATADGYLGPDTIRRLQRSLKTPVDGVISRPSTMVRELQRRLNNGTF